MKSQSTHDLRLATSHVQNVSCASNLAGKLERNLSALPKPVGISTSLKSTTPSDQATISAIFVTNTYRSRWSKTKLNMYMTNYIFLMLYAAHEQNHKSFFYGFKQSFKIYATLVVHSVILKYVITSDIDNARMLTELIKIDQYDYNLTFKNMVYLDLFIRQVSTGMSLRKTALSAQKTKMVIGGGDLRDITESVYVRSIVAIHFEIIHSLSSAWCWGDNIAFDTANNSGDFHLDL